MSETPHTVLIVGASRGLGLGLAQEYLKRGWCVIATVRGAGQSPALRDIAAKNPAALKVETVDINEPSQVAAFRERLEGQVLDVLFVNAGVANDPQETIGAVSTEEFIRVMVTNALSPMRLVERFSNLVRSRGVIAVMSSGLGSVAGNDTGGWEVCRASKAALNTLMRSFAARSGQPRTLLTIAPGWVRTDMGGPAAPLDVETSIRGVVDTIEARAGTPGVTFANYKNEMIPW